MTLRRRLVLLHSAFAAFAVIAASAIIYSVQVYTERVADQLESMIAEARRIESLRVDLKILDVHLHELVTGRRAADAAFDGQREALLARLDSVIRFAGYIQTDTVKPGPQLAALRDDLAAAVEQCVTLVRAERREDAEEVFKNQIESGLIAHLDVRLGRLRGLLDERRSGASARLFARNGHLLYVSLGVALGGVGLVVAGAIVVRRRLVAPIALLKDATEAFARGDLAHRVQVETTDELGVLGESLNAMASSLRSSQRKFRSLFENQRDAVLVCDRSGVLREFHDGDAHLPVPPADALIGRRLAEVWPGGAEVGQVWSELVARVFARGATIRVTELRIPAGDGGERVFDVVAYPVDYASEPYAALVLRDAAERVRLQTELRRSETMTAAMTIARGIAHDFKNLLHSALNTLTLLADDATDAVMRERAQSALAACTQAAGLSRRLSRFAGADRGNPERVPLRDTVAMILGSLDEGFRAELTIELAGPADLEVVIDRDHLTQIVLNLLVNAREALTPGGAIHVDVATDRTADPRDPAVVRPFAELTVRDTGCGMAPATLERIFQPFFTSKPRKDHGPRGLGLAVVYALVNHAGGFIRVDSALGAGSAFHVFLPLPVDAHVPV